MITALYVTKVILLGLLLLFPMLIAVRVSMRLCRVNRKLTVIPIVVIAGHILCVVTLRISVLLVLEAISVGFIIGRLSACCDEKEAKDDTVR